MEDHCEVPVEFLDKETTLGQRIRQMRKLRHFSTTDFAEKFSSNVPQSLVSYWENDKREPSLSRLIEMATFCKVPLLWLLLGEDLHKSSPHFSQTIRDIVDTEVLYSMEPEGVGFYSEDDLKDLDYRISNHIEKAIQEWNNSIYGYPEHFTYEDYVNYEPSDFIDEEDKE